MNTISTIAREASRRVLVIDGAMGTMIQGYHLTEADYRGERFADLPGQQKGNNDLLVLTRPDVIGAIHRRYLEAGADIIETNTFSAQRVSMAEYHCEDLVQEINAAAVRLARTLADEFTAADPSKPRFVAGSIGPTSKACAIATDTDDPAARAITFDALAAAYEEQIDVLIAEGVDALLCETIFDTLNAKAAIYAAQTVMERRGVRVPIMLSASLAGQGGRLLSGQTLPAFLASTAHARPLSVGLNCSFGARDMEPFVAQLAAEAPCLVSAYPNAGLPDEMGRYSQTPEEMAAIIGDFLEAGIVNIVGGCCGTTDAHIAAIARRVDEAQRAGIPVRQPQPLPTTLTLAGLEPLHIPATGAFTPVGERCNVAGSRKFLRLIKEGAYDEALAIARKQIEDGARVIDINMDDGLLDAEHEMRHFVNLISADPDVCRVPFMIDSSKWAVVRAALKCVQGKCVVNSISLKEGEKAFLDHARELRRYGAAVVVMAFDEEGQATTCERRVTICRRAYRLLTEVAGLPPQDIIFDPNVLAVCTGMAEHDGYAADFIRAVKILRSEMPLAHVSGGVSNLSFAFRGHNLIREAMHAVFLHHARAVGMDFAIVNAATLMRYDEVPEVLRPAIDDVVAAAPGASERLLEIAANDSALTAGRTAGAAKGDDWRHTPVEERLAHALIHGVADHLREDLDEARGQYAHAVDIIEGPLMHAMDIVGERFGAGHMFLPQVVKTARTMKAAVAILTPHIEAEQVEGAAKAGHVVMATVKGDVHDIGKNIVATVLTCNNYSVCDLGVMCPAERIVEATLSEKPDFIGLSGLITPSLDEMIATARALRAAGISVPIVLGGATTSALHTALKIAPEYDGPVVWVKDASQMVLTAARLTDSASAAAFIADNLAQQAALREGYQAKQTPQVASLDEARKNKLNLFPEA